PASTVQIRNGAFLTHQFWDPEGIADVRFTKDHDYVEAFKDHLETAVRARLRTCRPPCATITRGLHSSSIAVTAAQLLAASGNRLNAFTAVPEPGFTRDDLRGRYFDETPYVRQLAEVNRNIVPHFITQTRDPTPQEMAEVIRVSGEPIPILNGLWSFDIFAAARSAGHNVMLVGEMGNDTMSYIVWGLFSELLLIGRCASVYAGV